MPRVKGSKKSRKRIGTARMERKGGRRCSVNSAAVSCFRETNTSLNIHRFVGDIPVHYRLRQELGVSNIAGTLETPMKSLRR